jgi:hypothetical protein
LSERAGTAMGGVWKGGVGGECGGMRRRAWLSEDEAAVLLQLRGIVLVETTLGCDFVTSSSHPMQKDSHGD